MYELIAELIFLRNQQPADTQGIPPIWQKLAKTGTVFLIQGSAVWYDQIRGDWGRLADGAQHRSVTRE